MPEPAKKIDHRITGRGEGFYEGANRGDRNLGQIRMAVIDRVRARRCDRFGKRVKVGIQTVLLRVPVCQMRNAKSVDSKLAHS